VLHAQAQRRDDGHWGGTRRSRTPSRNAAEWSAVWVVLVMASAALWRPDAAWATHEVDHRFVVSGAVRAADGTPRANVKVVAAHPRTPLSETVFTDRNGAYSVLLHLHDSDAGDPVTVTVGDEVKTITAAYNPRDHRTPRQMQVDFGASVAAESDPSLWWVGIGGGVAVAGGLWYWRRARRASRRKRDDRGKSPRAGTSRLKGKSHA